jgi:hypothetical protein
LRVVALPEMVEIVVVEIVVVPLLLPLRVLLRVRSPMQVAQ